MRCLAPKEACVHFQLGKVPKGDGNLCVFQGSEGLKGESIHPKGCGKRVGKATFLAEFGELVKRTFDGLIREVYMKLQKDRKALFHFNIARKTLEG